MYAGCCACMHAFMHSVSYPQCLTSHQPLSSVCLRVPLVPPPPQAMRVMNKRMNMPNMQKILMEFEKQNERMEMTSEMMGDAIDDAMEVRLGRVGAVF